MKRETMRQPCREIGHEYWHSPLRIELTGEHWWECRYCATTIRTPGPQDPKALEKVLVKEIEGYLREQAE